MSGNPGLARCPRCGAYDAWEGEPKRVDLGGLVAIEHRCGVCGRTWRVPIRPSLDAQIRSVREPPGGA